MALTKISCAYACHWKRGYNFCLLGGIVLKIELVVFVYELINYFMRLLFFILGYVIYVATYMFMIIRNACTCAHSVAKYS